MIYFKSTFVFLLIMVLSKVSFAQQQSTQKLVDEIKRTKQPVDFRYEYRTYLNGNTKYEGWHYLINAVEKPGWLREFPYGTHKKYRRNGKLFSTCYFSINDSVNDTIHEFSKKGILVFTKIYNLAENLKYGSIPIDWLFPKVFEVIAYYKNTGSIKYRAKQHGFKFVGKYEEYYPNGQLQVMGTYDSHGKEIGEWLYYKTDGSLEKREKKKSD